MPPTVRASWAIDEALAQDVALGTVNELASPDRSPATSNPIFRRLSQRVLDRHHRASPCPALETGTSTSQRMHRPPHTRVSQYVLFARLSSSGPPATRIISIPGDLPLNKLYSAVMISLGWVGRHDGRFIILDNYYEVCVSRDRATSRLRRLYRSLLPTCMRCLGPSLAEDHVVLHQHMSSLDPPLSKTDEPGPPLTLRDLFEEEAEGPSPHPRRVWIRAWTTPVSLGGWMEMEIHLMGIDDGPPYLMTPRFPSSGGGGGGSWPWPVCLGGDGKMPVSLDPRCRAGELDDAWFRFVDGDGDVVHISQVDNLRWFGMWDLGDINWILRRAFNRFTTDLRTCKLPKA